jgi:hypothetical protein
MGWASPSRHGSHEVAQHDGVAEPSVDQMIRGGLAGNPDRLLPSAGEEDDRPEGAVGFHSPGHVLANRLGYPGLQEDSPPGRLGEGSSGVGYFTGVPGGPEDNGAAVVESSTKSMRCGRLTRRWTSV